MIPPQYQLIETNSVHYAARTEANVIDSDGTVVFTFGPPTGGSKKTVEFAGRHRRPCLSVDLAKATDAMAARAMREWLSSGPIGDAIPGPPPHPVLNVAGSRESKAPGIQQRVKAVLLLALPPPWPSQAPG